MAAVLIYILLIYTLLAYEIKYNSASFNSKHSAINDLFFLIEEIILVFFRELLTNDVAILSIYSIFSLIVSFLFFFNNPYYSIISRKCHLLFHLLISWNLVSVVLGRFFINNNDFMPLSLFLLGFPVVVLYCLFFSNNIIGLFNTKEKEGFDYLYKSLLLLDYIETYNASREKEVILDSYISFKESECFANDCALKQHIRERKANSGRNIIHLLLYLDSYFKEGLRKYPNYTLLRIYYSIFLFHKLRKTHQPLVELDKVNELDLSYYERYLIHKCKKEFDQSYHNVFISEISNSLIFITHSNQFKEKMIKASQSYLNFWNLLHLSNQEDKNNISKLSYIGNHINTINEEIKHHFEVMEGINPNDKDSLKYYSDYCIELLNDPVKGKKYFDRYIIIAKESESIEKEDIIDIDLNLLSKSDNIQYIILSLDCSVFNENDTKPNESIIKEASLGICETLGYTKKELIGESLNIIIPDLMRASHDRMINEKILMFKKKAIQSHIKKFQYKTIDSFALSKSKYIIPIFISAGIIPNEFDDYYLIAKLSIDELFFARNDQCYVLTDNFGNITNFSSSAISLLGLNSNDMKNNGDSLSIYDHMSEGLRKNSFGDSESVCLVKKKKKEVYKMKYNLKEVKWQKKQKKDNSSKGDSNINYTSLKGNNQSIFFLNEKILSIQNIKLGVIFYFEEKKAKSFNESSIVPNFIENVVQTAHETRKDNNNNNNSNHLIGINKDFIPENQDMFVFNFQQEKYLIGKENNNQHFTDLINQIKQNDINENTSHSSGKEKSESSYSYTESYSSNSSSNGITPFEEESKQNQKKSIDPNNKTPIIKDQIATTDYYNVDMKQIRYSIYNYETNTLENQPNYIKESQVEMRINEYVGQYKDIPIKKRTSKSNKNKQVLNVYESEIKEKETNLLRQLKFALSKYENYKEIAILQFFSLLILLITLGEGLFCFFFFKENISKFETIDTLISSTYDLLTNTMVTIYLVREMSLLHDENYTMFYINRDLHRSEVIKEMSDIYIKQEELLNKVMGIPEYFSNKSLNELYNTTQLIYIIRDDLKIDQYNISLFAALSDMFDSLYQITQMPIEKVIPSNNYVYSFVVNSLNGINLGLKGQASIFINELFSFNKKTQTNAYIVLGISFIIGGLLYLIISSIYFKVARKKNDYLNIFYEISNDVIKRALIRCEIFYSKLLSKIDHIETISIDDYDKYSENDLDEEEGSCTLQKNDDNLPLSSSKSKFKTVAQCSFEDILVNVFLIFFFGLICIVLIIIISVFNVFLDKSYYSIIVYRGEIILQARYLNIFNIFREYMFDESINVFYTPLKTEIEAIFHLIYDDLAERAELKEKYGKYCSKEYLKISLQIDNEGLCGYVSQFFPPSISKVYSCSDVTYKTADLGLAILLTFYSEEIKEMKNAYKVTMEEARAKNYFYNYTLLGLPEYNALFPTDPEEQKDYLKYHPIKYFTNEKHDELLILFNYILLPIIIKKNQAMSQGVTSIRQNFSNALIISISIYSAIIFLTYFFIWRRIQNNINDTIYKTKNMLNIIPQDVLIHLRSIQKIFNLNTNKEPDN